MTTPILGLTEVAAAQSQPHVPINEATRALEIFGQIIVITTLDTAPPVSAAEGDAYVIADGATGDWAGHDNEVAYYSGGAWLFLTPRIGWLAYSLYDTTNYRYNGNSPNGWAVDAGAGDASTIPYDSTITIADALDALLADVLELRKIGIPYAQPGKPGDAATYNIMIPHALEIPAGLANSFGYAGTTSTGSAVYNLHKNGGAAFGTVTFSTGNATPVFAAATATSFVAGDRLTIIAPTPQDATLADVGFTIYARRSI